MKALGAANKTKNDTTQNDETTAMEAQKKPDAAAEQEKSKPKMQGRQRVHVRASTVFLRPT
jgi:hypothetical protein